MSDFAEKFVKECKDKVDSIKGLPYKQMQLLKLKAHMDNLQKMLDLGKEQQIEVLSYVSMSSIGIPYPVERFESEIKKAKEKLAKYDHDIKVMELLKK